MGTKIDKIILITTKHILFQIYSVMTAIITKMSTPPVTSTLSVVARQIYTYTKNVVKENTSNGDGVEVTPFGTCLVSALSNNNNIESKYIRLKDNHETYVNCELIDNKLILSKASKDDIATCLLRNKENIKRKTAGTLKIRHFDQCPALHMSEEQRESIPIPVKERNIGVAVAVLLGK